MYVASLVSESSKARFICEARINYNDLEDSLKKLKEYK